MLPPTPICLGEGRREALFPFQLFTRLAERPCGQTSLAFSLPRSRVQAPLTLTPAFLAARVRGRLLGGGSDRPRPRDALTGPCPAATRPDPAPPRPSSAQHSRRGNPLQSQAYVHRASCAPSRGGPRELRSAACCRRSAGVTPIRCRRTGKETGSRWTAGCPSSARRLGAWDSAYMGGAGLGRPVCKRPVPGSKGSPTPTPVPSLRRETLAWREQGPSLHTASVSIQGLGRPWAWAAAQPW